MLRFNCKKNRQSVLDYVNTPKTQNQRAVPPCILFHVQVHSGWRFYNNASRFLAKSPIGSCSSRVEVVCGSRDDV